MRIVNRAAVIVRPRAPYLQWAAQYDAEAGTDDTLRGHLSVYLVPEDPRGVDEAAPLESYFQEIFETELAAWVTDSAQWPPDRDLPTFLDWFTVKAQSLVVDLGHDPLAIEA